MREKDIWIKKLEPVFGKEKPLAKMLGAAPDYFLYNTGTNKILSCTPDIYHLMNNLLSLDMGVAVQNFIQRHGEARFITAAEEILAAIDGEKILSTQRATRFGLSAHFSDLKTVLATSVEAINLEVSQECNLRCRYCIYQDHFKEKRNHGHKIMSFEVAQKAIQLLKNHCSGRELGSIGFYGGEPLTRFSFIKDCVAYAKRIFDGQPLNFNITTNATLITPEVAQYLMAEGFGVTVSLDGPQEYHDRFRKDAHGLGSFDRALNGLRLLSEQYRQTQKGKILINVVYTPPFKQSKIEAINRFFQSLPWLPPDVHISTRYPADQSIPMEYAEAGDLEEDINLTDWAFHQYSKEAGQSAAIVRGQIEERFAKFIQRPVLTEPVDSYGLNGCCVPGQRKNYITADGDIHLCEKTPSNCPPLGHVDTGFDYETIKKIYIENYAQQSMASCATCWGLRLCDVCYVYAFNENGELDMTKKKAHCTTMLDSVAQSLSGFATLLEKSPEQLDYLYHFDII